MVFPLSADFPSPAEIIFDASLLTRPAFSLGDFSAFEPSRRQCDTPS
jgi:hypothetical protein